MGLHRYAWLTAAMTFFLLLAGGLVTSTDSGLAVPDWPLSYGTLFPPMVGGIRYEHTHRLIAAVVGLMIAVLTGWLWRVEPRRWVRALGYTALMAVLVQAILGGLTVLLVLPAPISVAHACVGQVVFCLVVSLVAVTSPHWQTPRVTVDDPWLRVLCPMFAGGLFFQLFIGALLRHSGGAVIWHIGGAAAVVVLVAALLWRAVRVVRRVAHLRRLVVLIAIALSAQVLLGVLVLVSGEHVLITTAHVALGALILAGACVLTFLTAGSNGLSRLPPAPLAISEPLT